MIKGRIGSSKIKVFMRNRLALVGLGVIFLVTGMAVFAPYVSRYDPSRQDLSHRLTAPSLQYWFGTDKYGRDIYSRIVYGSKISLVVGFLSACLGMAVGVFLGLTTGYFGGKTDGFIMRVVDVIMALPSLILAMAIVLALGPGSVANLTIGIGISLVPQFTRIARAETISIKNNLYVEAAVALGARPFRIILLHILPNAAAPILIVFTLYIANAIRIEAGLSFLGMGVLLPVPTWGNIISEGRSYLQNAPWISTISGAAIMVTVLAFNIVGDALRDVLDPRLRGVL